MDPMIIAASLLAAREIVQAINAGRKLSEEQVAAIIAANAQKIENVKALIQSEMDRYGGNK